MSVNNLKSFVIYIILISSYTLIISCSQERDDIQNDIIDPTISIISPIDESSHTTLLNVDIEANDDQFIDKVELYLNNILIGFDSDFPYKFSVDVTSYPSGKYSLKGVAWDSSNNSDETEILITIITPSFNPPTNLIASQGDFNNKISLSWASVPDAKKYQVYKISNLTGEYEVIGETSKNTFEDTNITNSLTQYFYKVRVYNSETEFSEFSEEIYGYTHSQPYNILYSFGEGGREDYQFGFVALISINNNDELFLSDGDNRNIKKYSVNGNYLGLFKSNIDSRAPNFVYNKTLLSNEYNLIIEENNIEVFNNNTSMNLVGQFAVDSENNFYVPVNYNPTEGFNHHKIYKYDLNGNYMTSFGSKGEGQEEINEPWGLSVFNNLVVVTDQINAKATFFDTNGNFVKAWDFSHITNSLYGNFVKDNYIYIAAGDFVIKTDFSGAVIEKIGVNQLDFVTSVVVDSNNNIIVAEPSNRKIKVLAKQ
ncbi:Ig-like domain-containing protein [Aquimarina sp. 2-A2]|uniref:Ig-like domain-containing protein n=1 Tax=Aquimarina sp. 2-A2 TaxID=3382644 RepID=UPI00387EF08B